jgi:RNA polymerase sigma-70 factor (ECF subfamily)
MGGSSHEEGNLQNALKAKTAAAAPPDLGKIFAEHHRRVIRAAYRVTGNMEDAEDVLQTVFMRLARREGGSPLSNSLGSYLHRAAINAALDLVRSRRAARKTALEDVEPVLAGDATKQPDRAQRAEEIRELIRIGLGKASPKAAEIFVLRYFEGYGNHEIAKMLGTSRSTVNVILHRTRQSLREQIGEYVGEDQWQ